MPGANGFLPLSRFVVPEGPARRPLVGVLPGEGVGPEVMRSALDVLNALRRATGLDVEVRVGGAIGMEAQALHGRPLAADVEEFCRGVFAEGGVLLCGPGGGRFVYDMRRRFDLYCKVSPIRAHGALADAGPFRPGHVRGVDLLFVRDNAGGVYQGEWSERACPDAGRVAEHRFGYSERQVRRIAEVAARLAVSRRNRLAVVVKEGGVPTISRLWCDVTGEVAARHGIACEAINGDHAAYRVLREPHAFDVVLTPNMLGDLLIDSAALLQGTRALAISANYSGDGAAVYQTNHGSAHDLEGRDTANPAAQILALAMLLRESLGFPKEAARIERAVDEVWRAGRRTADLAPPGARTVGTREFGRLVASAVERPAPDPLLR